MKALGYLFAARALDAAWDAGRASATREEPLPPLATTPETAAAWRRWAQDAAEQDPWPPLPMPSTPRRAAQPAHPSARAG
jgi:hypothetical protein